MGLYGERETLHVLPKLCDRQRRQSGEGEEGFPFWKEAQKKWWTGRSSDSDSGLNSDDLIEIDEALRQFSISSR